MDEQFFIWITKETEREVTEKCAQKLVTLVYMFLIFGLKPRNP